LILEVVDVVLCRPAELDLAAALRSSRCTAAPTR
jgi:hypothetical protein